MRTLTDGKKIRRLRERQGLSTSQLAAKVGVDYKYICKIENNTRDGSPEKRLAIANALGVDLDDITFQATSRRALQVAA
jgi:transcriptional regulator with XRE-family HTH domain